MDEVTLPRTRVSTLAGEGGEYRVFAAWPEQPAPAAGFPVVYLLDAESAFGTMVEAVRMRARRPDATGVPPAVVVGISHAGPDARNRRTFDFTPPDLVPPAGEWPDGQAPRTGGANGMLRVLDNVRADVEARYAVDPARRMLFGHSLGGFFVLHALFEQPGAFRAFVAASPSIWWDVAGTQARADRLAGASGPAPRVMLTAGEFEQALAPWQPASDFTSAVGARRDRRRMIEHVEALAGRLAPLHQRGGRVSCTVFGGADHASVVTLTVSESLRFGLGGDA